MLKTIFRAVLNRTPLYHIFPSPLIEHQYYFKLKEKQWKPAVIYALDARISPAGMTDVLRGMFSAYAFSKAIKLPFYIDFQYPFRFEEYLQPVGFDWRLPQNLRTNNLFHTTVFNIVDRDEGGVLKYPWIRSRQYHFYTNMDFIALINKKYGKNYNKKDLYHELFKPSDSLQQKNDAVQRRIDGDYISLSFRFTTLLGDFEDSINCPLSIEDQKDLIDRSIGVINNLHNQYPHEKIFVASDSEKFTDSVKDIGYVYTNTGRKGQFYYAPNDDVTMNTFLDFLVISCAKRVYQAHTGKMFYGKFSKFAAMVSGIPFEVIEY